MIGPLGGRHCYDTASSTWEAVRKRRVVLNAKNETPRVSSCFRKCIDRTQLRQFSNLACWLSWEIYSKASCLHFTPAWPCTRQYSLNLLGLLSPSALILHDLESCVPLWVRILGFQPHPHLHNLWCCLGTASGGVNWSPSRGEGLTHTLDTSWFCKLATSFTHHRHHDLLKL